MRYKAALEVTLLTVSGLTLQVAHQPATPGSIPKQWVLFWRIRSFNSFMESVGSNIDSVGSITVPFFRNCSMNFVSLSLSVPLPLRDNLESQQLAERIARYLICNSLFSYFLYSFMKFTAYLIWRARWWIHLDTPPVHLGVFAVVIRSVTPTIHPLGSALLEHLHMTDQLGAL